MLKYDSFRPTTKYEITPQTSKLLLQKIIIIFFIQYKNEWKEHKFQRQICFFKKNRFLQKQKKAFKIDVIDVNNILVSKEEPRRINGSIKYFIGYSHNDVIIPLCIIPSQMIYYAKHFESNKTMNFKISDKKLLKKYTQIWKKSQKFIQYKT